MGDVMLFRVGRCFAPWRHREPPVAADDRPRLRRRALRASRTRSRGTRSLARGSRRRSSRAIGATDMGFLRRNDNAKPDYTALQLQTSDLDAADSDRMGTEPHLAQPHLVRQFQAVPLVRQGGRRQGRRCQLGQGLRQRGGGRTTPIPPTSSWRCARGRSPAADRAVRHRHRQHLEEPRDLHAARTRPRLLSRLDAAGRSGPISPTLSV